MEVKAVGIFISSETIKTKEGTLLYKINILVDDQIMVFYTDKIQDGLEQFTKVGLRLKIVQRKDGLKVQLGGIDTLK